MVFAKAPIPGQVKTRLGYSLGKRRAAHIYQQLLYEMLAKLSSCRDISLELWCYPDTRHPFFRKCAREFDLVLRRQQGADLGSRMLHAFRVNKSYRYAVLSGSDIPDLDCTHIEQSVRLLEGKADIVLLPTVDGGYGLVAMTGLFPGLFTNMKWSTERVLRQTVSRATKKGLRYRLLHNLSDIDDKSDYIRYIRRCEIASG